MQVAANAVVDGRYRIIRRLGAGGMAEVWCAEDTQLDRKVALKVLQRRFAQDHEFVERFRREASAAAGLQHPNVVNVFDRGEVDGTYYIAMEYVEGASLRDLINKGMSVEAAVGVCRQILAAARFAHSHGVIHRDLKPGNVLIDRQGRATVTDFGIAKAGVSEITQTGSVMGTAQYLSPEQAQGLGVTAASDLYSVGVILYEALTGRVPFEADSAVAVALKQVSEAPRPPSELNPAVPRALDAVVLKALAKDPGNRFASADEFEAALDAAEADPTSAPVETAIFAVPVAAAEATDVRAAPPPEEPPPQQGRRRWWRWALVALLVAALAGVAVWALTRPGQVTVPAVISETEEEARAALEEVGLEVETTRVSNDARPGTVLEQDPRAGERAERGSTVLLTVSQGPGFAEVPEVEGRTQRRAVDLLEEEGFLVETEGRPSNQIDPGRAIGTEPEQGTRLARGETVTLLVSEGPDLVEVPLVVGESQQTAEAELRGARFIVNVSTENSEEPRGTVIAQDPAGGTAEAGSVVRIVVSTGAAAVIVDSVVGRSQPAARATLRAQGLRVTTRREDVDDARDHGVVLEQAPRAGDRVPRGTTVTLVVGRFRDSD